MRTIDADVLKIDIVEEGQRSRRYKLGEIWELNRDEIYKVIDKQPTIEPEPQWIPCKERMPELDGKYLVSVNMDGHEYCDEDYWHRDSWNMYFKKSITAWMPKIEPYRENKE